MRVTVAFALKFCVPKQLSSRSIRTFSAFAEYQQQRKQLELELVSVLNGCTSFNQIKQVHAQLYQQGLEQQNYVITKLIRVLSNLAVPMEPYPRLIFQQVKYPNPFLWASLIRGYSVQGSLPESIRLYGRMRSECVRPVSFTFAALLKACGGVRDVDLGRQLHAQTILIGGFDSDLIVENTLIDMYVKCGVLGCARLMFDEMPKRDVFSWTMLVVAFAKSGDMEAADRLFDELPDRDMVAWTSMVTGYAQNGRPSEALECFGRMQQAGVGTDEVTLAGVISACAQLGAVNYAHWVRDIAGKSEFSPTESVLIGSALVDMYAKCGSIDDAYKVFTLMRERNVFSYSSMILGFATHGQPRAAFQLFNEMMKTGVKPNGVTFLGLLAASRHAGMVQQGRQLFAMMRGSYGIEPSVHHYGCMVDLLSRAGHLEEALELVKAMPEEPNGAVWGTLLGACRIHGNPDIAQIAASHLFELEPNVMANYTLLIAIYASAGRWADASKVRKLMRDKGPKNNPGYSWVDSLTEEIHESFPC